jgi:hypothetical protein
MARPRQASIRDQKMTLRLTAKEIVAVRQRAAKSHQTPTDFARAQMLTKKRGRKPASTGKQVALAVIEPEVFHELRRIGVNLNQIARHCNTYQVPPPAGVDRLVRDIAVLLNQSRPGHGS